MKKETEIPTLTDSTQPTSFSNKCDILADLWINFREDEEFVEFIEYNDLGMPLAYAMSTKIVEPTEEAKAFIDEAWELLLAGLNIEEDNGFDNLDQVLGIEKYDEDK